MSIRRNKANLVKVEGDLNDALYQPTPAQVKARAALRNAMANNFTMTATTMSLEDMVRLTGENRIRSWAKTDGFVDWMRGYKDDFEARAESLADMALEALEGVLRHGSDKDKVSAAKIVLEARGYLGKHQGKTTVLDDYIQRMDRAQLENFLRAHGAIQATPTEPLALDTGTHEEASQLLSQKE